VYWLEVDMGEIEQDRPSYYYYSDLQDADKPGLPNVRHSDIFWLEAFATEGKEEQRRKNFFHIDMRVERV
jgi:hypothetical protein